MLTRRRAATLILISWALVAMSGCGSPLTTSSNRVAGAWLANATLAAAGGGDCLGAALQNAAGIRDVFTTAIRQEGTSLQATIASQGNGTICAYSGAVASQAVSLNLASCQSGRVVGARCENGEVRDLQLVAESITASVNADQGSGTGRDVSSWDVLAPGTQTKLATLTTTADFSWVFLGLPSSDYHVFTGTVFPGYDDGTIAIPADPNPFCTRCGWFYR